jgi:ABC-type transporter Mla subunit MlaD
MKRILVTLGLIAAAAASAVTVAGAADSRTYQAELFNAFGLVKGSELRVAGVKAGTITDLEVTPQKTALVSFEVDPEFPEFKADASCSSEPQSLIAEYFLDCQPGVSPDPLEGPIPAAQNKTTVQPDLAQNTLREPFKDRLRLLINEFGTALDANAENLNAAIRSGAPALQELKQVLNILGRQNTTIAQLNADADAIFAQLADRREDVVNFIDNAGRTAAISAERSEDLSRNFDLLDDFLAELQPTMVELEKLARYQAPLLTDLRAAAPGLNKLATNLPPFNRGTRDSLLSLGRAAAVGKVALDKSKEEIAALNQTSTKAYPAADEVAKFLESIDDPSNATEEDCDARRDLRDQPGEADRRVALLEQKLGTDLTGDQSLPDCDAGTGSGNPGYTGMEGLLNYAYTQTLSLNLFDQLGHGLALTLVSAPGGNDACGYQAGQEVPAKGFNTTHETTTDPTNFAECAGILGDRQPNINYAANPSGLFGNLGPYHPSVCPDGSTNLAVCDPNAAPSASAALPQGGTTPQAATPEQQEQQEQQQKQIEKILGENPGKELTEEAQKKLEEILNLPPPPQVPKPPQLPNQVSPSLPSLGGSGSSGSSGSGSSATGNILDFILGQ